jgi:prophage regulatory protein
MGNYMGRNDTGGHPMRFLKLKEVMEKTALSRSAIYRKMNEEDFPKSVSLGDRAVAWLEEDVVNWMEECLLNRDR